VSTSNNHPAEDDELDYDLLDALRGDYDDYEGPLDHVCPLCGPACRAEYNRRRPTLRTWKLGSGVISYNCVRCGAKGYVTADAAHMLRPRPRMRPPVKPYPHINLREVERIWGQACTNHPVIVAYFRSRGILLDEMPEGALRFHPECPWLGLKIPCVLARYSDAVTGKPKGIWRRPVDGLNAPMTLGPMGGCVIRLWPDAQVGKRLVIGEGLETTLAAATRVAHRGQPLYPAWAMGCAGNMRRFQVLDSVEQLVILVDNDSSETGQKAGEECARRWSGAGREVIRLVPRKLDSDFNDLVKP
jgi:Toprim domain